MWALAMRCSEGTVKSTLHAALGRLTRRVKTPALVPASDLVIAYHSLPLVPDWRAYLALLAPLAGQVHALPQVERLLDKEPRNPGYLNLQAAILAINDPKLLSIFDRTKFIPAKNEEYKAIEDVGKLTGLIN